MNSIYIVCRERFCFETEQGQTRNEGEIISRYFTTGNDEFDEIARFETIDEAKSCLEDYYPDTVEIRENGKYKLCGSIFYIMKVEMTEKDSKKIEIVDGFSDYKVHPFTGELTLSQLSEKYDVSLLDLSVMFGVPYRTLKCWTKTELPNYLLHMMNRILFYEKGR